MTTTNSFEWKVKVSDDDLQRSARWVFRFAEADKPWQAGMDEISSSQVNVKAADPEDKGS